jgi:hypothetical protein
MIRSDKVLLQFEVNRVEFLLYSFVTRYTVFCYVCISNVFS